MQGEYWKISGNIGKYRYIFQEQPRPAAAGDGAAARPLHAQIVGVVVVGPFAAVVQPITRDVRDDAPERDRLEASGGLMDANDGGPDGRQLFGPTDRLGPRRRRPPKPTQRGVGAALRVGQIRAARHDLMRVGAAAAALPQEPIRLDA